MIAEPALARFNELIVGVQNRPAAQPTASRPASRRIVDRHLPVEMAGGVAPVLVVQTTYSWLYYDSACSLSSVSVRKPLMRLLGHNFKGATGTRLDV